MSDIKRFYWNYGGMAESGDGGYVLYSDHLDALIDEKTRQIDELEERLKAMDGDKS